MGERSIHDLRVEPTPGEVIFTAGWTIKRAPTNGTRILVSVGSTWTGCRTHWANGRTQPCMAVDCPWHAAGIASVWHGYLPSLDPRTAEHILFEFTDTAAVRFIEAKKRYGTLYGVKFSVSRASQKPNGRVVVNFGGKVPDPGSLLAEPAVLPILARIWRLDDGGFSSRDTTPVGGMNGEETNEVLKQLHQRADRFPEDSQAAELLDEFKRACGNGESR